MPYADLVPAFVMSGVGMALYFAPVANLVLSSVRRSEEGKASGVNNTVREVGGVFGVAALASVFAAAGSYVSPQAFVDGLIPALWVAAVAVGAATFAAIAIPAKQDVVESVSYLERRWARRTRRRSSRAEPRRTGGIRAGSGAARSPPAHRAPVYSPSRARCSSARSNLVIFRNACVTRAIASGSSALHHLAHVGGDDLPREAELVLEPAALALLTRRRR